MGRQQPCNGAVVNGSASNTVLLIICLMYLLLYVDRINIATAAPLIKADLDLTNTQLGLACSAFALSYALFQLIGDYIGDKFGPRSTLCASLPIVCVAPAATGVVERRRWTSHRNMLVPQAA
jgi:sugar phosphate permease